MVIQRTKHKIKAIDKILLFKKSASVIKNLTPNNGSTSNHTKPDPKPCENQQLFLCLDKLQMIRSLSAIASSSTDWFSLSSRTYSVSSWLGASGLWDRSVFWALWSLGVALETLLVLCLVPRSEQQKSWDFLGRRNSSWLMEFLLISLSSSMQCFSCSCYTSMFSSFCSRRLVRMCNFLFWVLSLSTSSWCFWICAQASCLNFQNYSSTYLIQRSLSTTCFQASSIFCFTRNISSFLAKDSCSLDLAFSLTLANSSSSFLILSQALSYLSLLALHAFSSSLSSPSAVSISRACQFLISLSVLLSSSSQLRQVRAVRALICPGKYTFTMEQMLSITAAGLSSTPVWGCSLAWGWDTKNCLALARGSRSRGNMARLPLSFGYSFFMIQQQLTVPFNQIIHSMGFCANRETWPDLLGTIFEDGTEVHRKGGSNN